MRFQQDLQVAVRDRQRRLLTEHFESAGHQIRLVADWIASQSTLVHLLNDAAKVEPELDVERLASEVLADRELRWSTKTEEGQATVIWAIMRHIASEVTEAPANARNLYLLGHGSLVNGWRQFAERILSPLFDYLLEQITQYSSVLHTIERYVHIVEWFTRSDLFSRYETRRSTGEELYNDDLQRFLYEDGGYITHAKVRSASGEADLTGGLDTVDPLICEGKIFDARGVPYIANGVHQIVKYAHDQRKSSAYLVIFNLTDKLLQFETGDSLTDWPSQLLVAGVTVNIVTVRALPPQQTASKSGRATIVKVGADQLTNPDSLLE